MTQPLEDYALIGDTQTAALVGRDGSIDWLCLPRFDSGSCFAKLIGDDDHGRWLTAPAGEVVATSRRYRPKTLVLETDMTTADGKVRITDFMPPRHHHPRVIRVGHWSGGPGCHALGARHPLRVRRGHPLGPAHRPRIAGRGRTERHLP